MFCFAYRLKLSYLYKDFTGTISDVKCKPLLGVLQSLSRDGILVILSVVFTLSYPNDGSVSMQLSTAAVTQWVRALTPQVEGWVFESQPRQT